MTALAIHRVQRSRSRLRVAALLLGLLLSAQAASAEFFDLYVDPSASRLRLSFGEVVLDLAPGLTATLPIQSQTGVSGTSAWALPGGFPGDGLETALFGVVLAEIDATPSQLSLNPTATIFAAGQSGLWVPMSGGTAGVAPANAGFRVQDPLLGIDLLGALRDVGGSIESTLQLTPDGPNAWTAAGSLDLHLAKGRLHYDSILPGLSGSGPLRTGGAAIASATIAGGRYEILSGDVGRLELPFVTAPFVLYADELGGAVPLSFTATLAGTLVAYSKAVPEPSTTLGLLMGVAALVLLSRRRTNRRSAPSRPRSRELARYGALGLLLTGALEIACVPPSIEGDADPDWLASFEVTYAGQPQCGTTSLDTDGDGTPDVETTNCDTPASDTAPNVVATAAASGGTAEASVSQNWTDTGGTSVVCRLTAPTGGTAHCSASMSRSVILDLVPGTPADTTVSFHVVARTLALGPGATDPFSAEVVVQCPGQAPRTVALNAEHVRIDHVWDGIAAEPIVCNVTGSITESSTTQLGETFHKLIVGIYRTPPSTCRSDWDCGVARRCVTNGGNSSCEDGSAGAACQQPSDCSPSAPICYGLRCRAAGLLGDSCRVHRDCADGLLCDGIMCADPGQPTSISVDFATVTPDLNLIGGVRPRFTPSIELAAVAQTNQPMGEITATTVACQTSLVSDCDPAVAPLPAPATQWSVDLPDYASGVSGQAYQIDVTAKDTSNVPSPQARRVDFEVYPDDVGALVTCTKSYANGELSLGFTISPPPPATPGQVFDARLWLFRRSDAAGWILDPIDSIGGAFALQNPDILTPVYDGEFQVVFSGLIDFVTEFQTSLRFDTLGGPNDVCTLVP